MADIAFNIPKHWRTEIKSTNGLTGIVSHTRARLNHLNNTVTNIYVFFSVQYE